MADLLALLAARLRQVAAAIEPTTDTPPGGTRQERWLRRTAAGRLVASVELSQDDTDTLHQLGMLDDADLDDRQAIARAISKLLTTLRRMG